MRMGFDIYLEWTGMSDKYRQRQLCGYRIDYGRYGYIRIPAHMTREHKLIEAIFQTNPNSKKPFKYDFLSAKNVLNYDELVKQYVQESTQIRTERGFVDSMMWIDSVQDFFVLGQKLQIQRKNPTIRVDK